MIDENEEIVLEGLLNVNEAEFEKHQNEAYRNIMEAAIKACYSNLKDRKVEIQDYTDENSSDCTAMPYMFSACLEMALNRVRFLFKRIKFYKYFFPFFRTVRNL